MRAGKRSMTFFNESKLYLALYGNPMNGKGNFIPAINYIPEIAGMKIGIVNIMVNDETDYALGCMHSPYLLK